MFESLAIFLLVFLWMCVSILNFFKNILFIYLFMRDTQRKAETQAEGEGGSMHREPDVGFDPGSPGLRSGPKAGAKPLSHPKDPSILIF